MPTKSISDADKILGVIEAETSAYFAKDFEAWSQLWVHSVQTAKDIAFPNGAIHHSADWENIAPWMKRSMEMLPQQNSSNETLLRENLEITQQGDMAFVRYDQICLDTGEPFDVPGRRHECRTLLRRDSRWRILYCGSFQSRSEGQNNNWIGVSDSGEILSLPPKARIALRTSKILNEQHGYLRASCRPASKLLTQKLSWGAQLIEARRRKSIYAGISYFQETHPIVLCDVAEGWQEICWIIIEGSKIFISPSDPRQNENRLEIAADIYGLSETQLRLCRELCQGSDLSQAAEKLGVSVNTVRTHLQRTFDKTSVHSQHDLVRTLLSVENPL